MNNNTPPCRFDLTFIVLGIQNLSTIIPKNFVEIGSRDGYDANFVANHFGINHKDCIVFEPHPQSCNDIIEKYPHLTTFNNAISADASIKEFYIDKENVGACSLLKREGIDQDFIKVECIDMVSVINNLNLTNIDICKIDTEGTTLDVLKSFSDKISLVKSIQLECETIKSWENQSLYLEIKEFLHLHNFVEVLFCRLHAGQIDDFWIQGPFLK